MKWYDGDKGYWVNDAGERVDPPAYEHDGFECGVL